MIHQDTLWKGIIESLTDDFLRFFFPQYAHTVNFAVPFQYLNAELQQIMPDNATPIRHADQLIRVTTLAGEPLAFLELVWNSINGLRVANFIFLFVRFFVESPAFDYKICLD